MRNTVAKKEILQVLTNTTVALSHIEIKAALNGLCDRVTIYRVLDRLIEEGVIHKIVNIDGVIKYALCNTCTSTHAHSHNHVHFSCTNCKMVSCIDSVNPTLVLPQNYMVVEVNFMVTGLCPACN